LSGTYSLHIERLGYESYRSSVAIGEGEQKELAILLSHSIIKTQNINVTSSRTEVTLQQTPSSISIVTSDDIKNRNILTFDNVLQDVQGVTINRSSGINVNSLSIRGSSDVAGGGIGNRVLLLLDGRPSLTGDSKGALWSIIPLSIIERTEVVKGAFSSLYGSSAIGGVVNVITKKPAYKPYTAVNLNYGFYEKLSDSLRFSGSLLTFKGVDAVHSNTMGKFSYLLNFNYKQNDGHAQQTQYNLIGGTSKFMYDLFTNRDLEVTLQYTRSESGFPRYWKKDAGQLAEPYRIPGYYVGDNISKETQSIDAFYRAIPNSVSRYTTRFYYYRLNSESEYNPNNPVALQYAPGSSFITFIDSYNFGNISQVDFQLSKANYLISGIDLQWNIVKSNPAEILYGDQQMNNFAVYVQDQLTLAKTFAGSSILSAAIGGRYDYVKIVSGIETSQFSPKVSLLYSPDASGIFNSTVFRFLAGRAFRAPSIAEVYFKKELFGGFDFIYNPNLRPEEMLSAEIGVSKQYLNTLTFDASVFYNRYKNLIQYVNIGTSIYGPFQVQNVAESEVKGFELSLDYRSSLKIFNSGVDYYININYAYIDAKDISQGRKDDFLPYKPKHTINANANLEYRGFNLNLNAKYLSKIDEVLFYKNEEPEDYILTNLKLTKQITSNITAFIAVNNLFNTSYQELERFQAPNRNYNSGINIQF
jgi:outer membrane receptor protein involved in Fe transport